MFSPTIRARPDLSRATPIEVKAGGEMVMDFLVPKSQLFKITGHVSGGPNSPTPTAVGISLAFQTLTGWKCVHPDESDLRSCDRKLRTCVTSCRAPTPCRQMQAPPPRAAAIDVINADVTNVSLSTSVPASNIAGKVQVDGGGPAAFSACSRSAAAGRQRKFPTSLPLRPARRPTPGMDLSDWRRYLSESIARSVPPVAGHYVKDVRFRRPRSAE
jgi:hypothetical protein